MRNLNDIFVIESCSSDRLCNFSIWLILTPRNCVTVFDVLPIFISKWLLSKQWICFLIQRFMRLSKTPLVFLTTTNWFQIQMIIDYKKYKTESLIISRISKLWCYLIAQYIFLQMILVSCDEDEGNIDDVIYDLIMDIIKIRYDRSRRNSKWLRKPLRLQWSISN